MDTLSYLKNRKFGFLGHLSIRAKILFFPAIISIFMLASTCLFFNMIEDQSRLYSKVLHVVSSSQTTINQLENFTRYLYHSKHTIRDLQQAISIYKTQSNYFFDSIQPDAFLKQIIASNHSQESIKQLTQNLENKNPHLEKQYFAVMSDFAKLSDELSQYSQSQWQETQNITLKIIEKFMLILALSILSLIVSMVYVAVVITRPLHTMASAVKSFEMDNLSVQLPPETSDEVGGLSKALGSLMRYLSATFKALDLVVNELKQTKESHENSSHAKIQHLINANQQAQKPVESILNQAHLLSHTALSVEQTRYVQSILDNTKQLSCLVSGALDSSELNAGKEVVLTNQDFSVINMVTHVKSIVKPFAMDKRIRFSLDCDPLLRENYVGDEQHIEQVLVNMILNALKATDSGKVSLKIVCYQQLEQADILLFLVSDTGLGIAANRIPSLFDLNARENQTHTNGLGLATGKKLIEQMHGEIGVYSLEGKGSTFWFTVKLSKTMQPKSEENTTEIDMSHLSANILIVEDNIVNQKTLYHLLQQHHHECDIAKNGLEALEKITHKKYDLVLMDLHMPEMDGFTATAKILEEYKKDAPRIIALSADNSPQDYAKCIQHGMFTLFGKPISQKKLLQTIQTLLEKS